MNKTVTVQHLANVLNDTQVLLKNGHVSNGYYNSQVLAYTVLFGRPFVHAAIEIASKMPTEGK